MLNIYNKKMFMHHILVGIILVCLSGSFLMAQDDDFFEPHTTIGGYGELHYNAQSSAAKNSETLDFHRFVLFVAHGFSEKWSFKSELELEHNFVEGGEAGGEIALEQAFVNYQWSNQLAFQAGVLLAGVGFTNEFHEPPLFLSVERPDYAKYIIPATWYGNGVAATALVNGVDIKFAAMEGLNAADFRPKDGIRGGRQNGFKADARHLLYNLRVDFSGLPGVKIGGALLYNRAAYGKGQTIPVLVSELHLRYDAHGVIIVAEAGRVAYNTDHSSFPLKLSQGGYLDFGYDWSEVFGFSGKIITWLRWTDINPAANTSPGRNYRFQKKLIGVSVLPLPEIVFKADYGSRRSFNGSGTSRLFNLGMGYMF